MNGHIEDVIGIKFGSSTTVLGTLNEHVLDVLYSDTSSRTIPSMITFSGVSDNDQRLIGDSAQFSYLKNIFNTFTYLNRLISFTQDNIEYEKKFFYFALIEDDKKNFMFNLKEKKPSNLKDIIGINNKENKLILYPEVVIGSYLNKLSSIWHHSKKITNSIVISIPDYYSQHERIRMLNSIKISGLNCISLLNESSAICLSYYLHHFKDLSLSSKDQVVVFIDMGETKTSFHICMFNKSLAKIVFTKTNMFLGCRDFDYAIFDFIINSNKDYESIKANPKNKMKLMTSISKSRKILTVNTDSTVTCEVNDDDINFNITRDKFKEITTKQLEEFKALLHSVIEESNIGIKEIDCIEMVGDAIRNPLFQDMIYDEFQLNVSKTLLADECIARGCGLYNIMLNEYYSTIHDFNLIQYNHNDISVHFSNEVIDEKIVLLPKGENYPTKKSFRFHKGDVLGDSLKMSVTFTFTMNSKEEFINKFEVTLPKTDKNYILVLHLLIDSNCLPSLSGGFIEYENFISPTEFCFIRQSEVYNPLDVDLNELIAQEISMEFRDWCLSSFLNRKNEIESLVYLIRDSNTEFDYNKILKEIDEIEDISQLDKKYEEILLEHNMNKDKTFIEVEKMIRENISLLSEKKSKMDINKYITFGKHIQQVIRQEKDLKQEYSSQKEVISSKINKYKDEIQSI